MQLAPRATVRPPPDYSSRRVKWRLFVILAGIMLVFSVIERAADPEFRRWLTGAAPVEPEKPLDNRLADADWRTAGDALGTFVAEVGTEKVRDDTPVFRPAEQEAWFAAVAAVKAEAPAQATPAAYVQLFNQPDEYRGQFVKVRGTVRRAYRVPALENDLGVEDYCVYWIHPLGGPSSPLLVYALTAPPDFPIADSAPEAERRQRKLYEDVEVTGIFLKRAAYAGQGGTFTAPLILARGVDWRRADEAPARLPLTPLELALAASVALVFAVCLTAVLWKRSRRPRAHHASGGFPDLGPLALGPTPRERLAELERQAQRKGSE